MWGRLKSAFRLRFTPRRVKKKKVIMEDLHSEIHQNSGIKTKASEGAEALDNRTLSTQAWSNNLNEPARQALSTDVAVEDSALFTPLSEPSLGLIFKMATSLLQPLCLGGSPVVLPVHLQVAGGADPQVGQTVASPVIAPSPASLSLPLILDQPGLQCLSSQLLLQSSCLIPEQQYLSGAEQNHGPSQNLSVPLSQPQHGEEKSDILSQPSDNSALHCSKFTTVLQEPFHFLRNYGSSPCQGTRSVPSNPFLPQESPLPYLYTGSPLVSLVPPATLLVPYPLIVPLPVPLPIPIPIPIPVSFPDSKALSSSPSAAYSTKKNKSTQTSKDAFGIPTVTHSTKSDCRCLQLPRLPLPSISQQEVLDLRIKVTPIQTKQEVQFPLPQDSALDLSVANNSYFKSCAGSKLKYYRNNSANEDLTERIIHPIKYSRRHEPNHLNSHSDIDFGTQYKWTKERYFSENTAKSAGQNSRVIGPLQTPAVFCEKLVRQPQEHILKNRVVKLKRMTSQSMNIHPVKKQHVATFRPTK
ncbi:retinoic acid-induced protein 2 [Colossoma macropomum]|uniref:retinoic acid-induced protein 2 n=1 Tax=Colossoma macropomum TaxID=42526 RepID=UPI001864E97B|nr:retinoic acid-induced protein 2 [Colossoma macropomum]